MPATALQLHRSRKSSTGYLGVTADGSRFKAQHRSGGKIIHLGSYAAAVEAAEAIATYLLPAGEVEAHQKQVVKGYTLLRSRSSKTGYVGVYPSGDKFGAQLRKSGQRIYLGTYDTAVEAAVAIAKLDAAKRIAPPPSVGTAPVIAVLAAASDTEASEVSTSSDEESLPDSHISLDCALDIFEQAALWTD